MKRVQCIRLIQEIFIAAAFLFSPPPTLLADQDQRGGTARPVPQRVISLGQTITERIYLLGAGDRLVANTVYCVEPEDAKYKEKIGTLLQANLEKIISLKPDLVIASNLARQKQLTKLKAMGIRVVQFSYPKSFEQMCRQFIELGEILGQGKTAEEIVQDARKRVAAIRMKVEGLPQKTVFMQLGIKPLHAVTKKSFLNDYIELGGGINVALNEGGGTYSREKVLSVNPEVIIVATMGSSEGEAGKREKERWMTYPSIAAVKNQNVYVVDPDKLCSPTPVTFVEALREIAGLIHPDPGQGDVK